MLNEEQMSEIETLLDRRKLLMRISDGDHECDDVVFISDVINILARYAGVKEENLDETSLTKMIQDLSPSLLFITHVALICRALSHKEVVDALLAGGFPQQQIDALLQLLNSIYTASLGEKKREKLILSE